MNVDLVEPSENFYFSRGPSQKPLEPVIETRLRSCPKDPLRIHAKTSLDLRLNKSVISISRNTHNVGGHPFPALRCPEFMLSLFVAGQRNKRESKERNKVCRHKPVNEVMISDIIPDLFVSVHSVCIENLERPISICVWNLYPKFLPPYGRCADVSE